MFDLLVFIGRFQPFHKEHERILRIALENSHNVLVLVGSAGNARSIRNPFNYQERKFMIESSAPFGRVHVEPLFDRTYDDAAWVNQVKRIVTEKAIQLNNTIPHLNLNGTGRVGIIGANKDSSSYYLSLFPQWESVIIPVENKINATDIRKDFFEEIAITNVSPPVGKLMLAFSESEVAEQLRREYWHVDDYKAHWEAAPYPVKHLTVDAVVEFRRHVLLIERKSFPGKGLLALPGGHLEVDERMIDGVLRELREETTIEVPDEVLRKSIVATQIFDDPQRSTIGRVVTFGAHIRIPDNVRAASVIGADDAAKAMWVPIDELREHKMYDDHYHIIKYFLA